MDISTVNTIRGKTDYSTLLARSMAGYIRRALQEPSKVYYVTFFPSSDFLTCSFDVFREYTPRFAMIFRFV
jgi:hypothetical protein